MGNEFEILFFIFFIKYPQLNIFCRYRIKPFFQNETPNSLSLIPIDLIDPKLEIRNLVRERLELLYDLIPTLRGGVPTYEVRVKTSSEFGSGAILLDKIAIK